MIPISDLLKHYKRPEVQEAMITASQNREVAVKYGDHGFGKRPDILRNPSDILEFVKNGATSFHVSEERWNNPLLLTAGQPRHEIDSIRTGWDLILDIDCKELEYSKICAHLLLEAIAYHGIQSVTCKFSGNHGFHLAIPFEAFPQEVHGRPVSLLFPEGPRKIAAHLKEMIRPHLSEQMASREPDLKCIARKAGVEISKITTSSGELDPFGALSIDTILLSSRHLYRMPYSFNEKSGLVSIPIDPHQILAFDKSQAESSGVRVRHLFLDTTHTLPSEARRLFIQAFDFSTPIRKDHQGSDLAREAHHPFQELNFAIQEDYFPPCIKLILAGISDGKKRGSFILVNFLRSVGWDQTKIEERLRAWNKSNPHGQLREQDLLAPLRYHFGKTKIMPPNCDNQQYYIDLGVCKPDNLCQRIKNPVQYSLVKVQAITRHEQKKILRKKEPETAVSGEDKIVK